MSCDINSFYYNLPASVRGKPLSLEPFDEFEEWHLKCGHYQLLCAFKGSAVVLKSVLSSPLKVVRSLLGGVMERNKWKCNWNGHKVWELQR